MFALDLKNDPTPENVAKIEECETQNAKAHYLDKEYATLMEGKKHDWQSGIAGISFPNSSEYRDLLEMINKNKPLEGSLRCSLLIATFMNMPRETAEEI